MNHVWSAVIGWLCATAAVAGPWRVDGDLAPGSGANDGSTWADAFQGSSGLQLAIDAAVTAGGGEVWARASTTLYDPIQLANGVRVYGGFSGSETTASQSNPLVNETVISGGGQGGQTVVTSQSNDATAVLRGFVIQDGWNTTGTYITDSVGGGIRIEDGSPTIVDCEIAGCFAQIGAGISVRNGDPSFVNCIFHDNGERDSGLPPPDDKDWTLGGGAAYVDHGAPQFHNCLFYRNKAYQAGAAALGRAAAGTIFVNCTMTANWARDYYGALADEFGGSGFHSGIIWGNTAGVAVNDYYVRGNTWVVSYSNVAGLAPGVANIDADPLFLDAASDDYRLSTSSPCLDAGSDAILPLDVADLDWDETDPQQVLPLDLLRTVRSQCTALDMGPFEVDSTQFACCLDSDCGASNVCCDHVCAAGDCCDDLTCGAGSVCCDNTCAVGTCCASSDCDQGAGEVCCANTCTATVECCADDDCGFLGICCSNVCVNGAGACCSNNDCGGGTPYCCGDFCSAACCSDSQCGKLKICCAGVCTLASSGCGSQ